MNLFTISFKVAGEICLYAQVWNIKSGCGTNRALQAWNTSVLLPKTIQLQSYKNLLRQIGNCASHVHYLEIKNPLCFGIIALLSDFSILWSLPPQVARKGMERAENGQNLDDSCRSDTTHMVKKCDSLFFSLRRRKVISAHNLLPSCSMGSNTMNFTLDQVTYRLFSPY